MPLATVLDPFFTHSFQSISSVAVKDWVTILDLTPLKKPTSPRSNTLQLLLNRPQGLQEIRITAGVCEYYFDLSSTLTLDSDITLDATTVPAGSFEITYSNEQRGEYKLLEAKTDNREHSIPKRVVLPSGKIIHLKPAEGSPLDQASNAETILKEQGEVINTGQIESLSPAYGKLQVLNLDSLVYAEQGLKIELWSGSAKDNLTLSSRLHWNPLSISYLPAETLGEDMKEVSLHSLSIALLALAKSKDLAKGYSLCQALVNIWAKDLNNIIDGEINPDAQPGLPSSLFRPHASNVPASELYTADRDTKDLCWLGIALCEMVVVFRDRNTPFELPQYTDYLLLQLAITVAELVELGSGAVFSGLSQYGTVNDAHLIDNALLADLFLSIYLSLHDDDFVKTRARRVRSHILRSSPIPTTSFITQVTDTDLMRLATYKLWWAVRLKRVDEYALNAQYVESLYNKTTFPFGEKELFIHLVNHELKDVDLGLINNWSLDEATVDLGHGYYANRDSPLPTLQATSWHLLEDAVNLIEIDPFPLYVEEGMLGVANSFIVLQTMIPKGLFWTSEVAISNTNSVLGALLLSTSALAFNWYCDFAQLKKASLKDAQGRTLTLWSHLLNLPRVRLQSDAYLRSLLIPFLDNANHTQRLDTLNAILDAFDLEYEIREDFWPSQLYTLNASGQLVSVPFVLSVETIEVIQAQGGLIEPVPGGGADEYKLVPLSHYSAQVEFVFKDSHLSPLVDYRLQLRLLRNVLLPMFMPAGIGSPLTIIKTFVSSVSTIRGYILNRI